MRPTKFYPVSIVSFLLIFAVACSKSGDEKETKLQAVTGNQDNLQCAEALQVCVGDEILTPNLDRFEPKLITEIVAPGGLSAAERKRVADGGPEVGPIWERDLREISRQKGLRILTPGIHELLPGEFYGALFEKMYRARGCAPGGFPCVGYSQQSWLYREVLLEEVLAIALSAESANPLYRRVSDRDGKGNAMAVAALGEKLLADGCARVHVVSQPLCVGDLYYAVGGTYSFDSAKAQTLTYVNESRTAAILQAPGTYSQRIDAEIKWSFAIYSNRGCVPGSEVLCLPALANIPLLRMDYGWRGYRLVNLVGLMLPGIKDPGHKRAILTLNDEGKLEDIAAEEVPNLFLGHGCTADSKVCVGEKYKTYDVNDDVEVLCEGLSADQNIAVVRRTYGVHTRVFTVKASLLRPLAPVPRRD